MFRELKLVYQKSLGHSRFSLIVSHPEYSIRNGERSTIRGDEFYIRLFFAIYSVGENCMDTLLG